MPALRPLFGRGEQGVAGALDIASSSSGSTFIKRMVKYHLQAIIGVGCLMEVKEGIDMADRIGLIAIGVVNFKDGCVETVADWTGVRDAALLGIELPSGPVDFHGPAE